MKKPKRGFYHLSRMWYGKRQLKKAEYVDEILFGLYYEKDGTEGEMTMRWYNLRNDVIPTAKLGVFEDAFNVLNKFKDIIKELAKYDNKSIQPDEFCKILKKCGFKDMTKEKKLKNGG